MHATRSCAHIHTCARANTHTHAHTHWPQTQPKQPLPSWPPVASHLVDSVSQLQRVEACCSVLQCVAVRWIVLGVFCSVLQYVAVCWKTSSFFTKIAHLVEFMSQSQCVAVRCSVLQCIAVCCSVLQCVAVCWNSVLQQCVESRVTIQCSVLKIASQNKR